MSTPIWTLVKALRLGCAKKGLSERETSARMQTAKVVVEEREFTVTMEQDPEDGWWIGLVQGLPGCGSQGSTATELRENVVDAICEYLAV